MLSRPIKDQREARAFKRAKRQNAIFRAVALGATLFGIAMLVIFLGDILDKGLGRLSWSFITDLPSRIARKTGIFTALVGSIWVVGFTLITAIPLGVGAGIYLEEYGRRSRMASLLEINVTNLAGVPSIIYGLLGLMVFGNLLGLGNSLIVGSFTLALLVLPTIIVATREALRSVPSPIREAAIGLGATKWQMLWHQVLPASSGGIITGVILALSRAIGETAPLIVVGALAYVAYPPLSPTDSYSVLPIQLFNWVGRPQKEFEAASAAAIIVLLCLVFVLNGLAVYLRNRAQNRVKW